MTTYLRLTLSSTVITRGTSKGKVAAAKKTRKLACDKDTSLTNEVELWLETMQKRRGLCPCYGMILCDRIAILFQCNINGHRLLRRRMEAGDLLKRTYARGI